MSRWIALIVTAALLPSPALATQLSKDAPELASQMATKTQELASQLTKKAPSCQSFKALARDAKRQESCRKAPAIPPVIDPTPLFLASTGDARPAVASIS
ncbi:MAG: hypothetical protein M3Q83_04650 [Pseudomonadota bacterium]|nr:hypothetical protein [Pseudomonadota bacterium]